MARPRFPYDHPDRGSILAEVHARPVELVAYPARVRRVAILLVQEPNAVAEAFRSFSAWCAGVGIEPPQAGSRQHSFNAAGRRVTWELHTEFVTLTWSGPLDDRENWPDAIGLEAIPGAGLIACVRIDLIDEAIIPKLILDQFRLTSLCHSTIDESGAQVATDFVVDRDSYTRFELAGQNLAPLRRAIVVRRLLEIETYRMLVLLALPLARRITPDLLTAERDLASAVASIGDARSLDLAQESLDKLHELSVRSGALIERTSYRFAASRAYGAILRQRLEQIREVPIRPASALTRFLGNRIDPALATCDAAEARQVALSEKIERAIELLNTRVGLDIQSQNRGILGGIAKTASSQLKLQRTVEGLSTIAISYYFLGILSYMLTGVGELAHFPKSIAVALAAPFVVLLVWLAVGAIRKQHSDH